MRFTLLFAVLVSVFAVGVLSLERVLVTEITYKKGLLKATLNVPSALKSDKGPVGSTSDLYIKFPVTSATGYDCSLSRFVRTPPEGARLSEGPVVSVTMHLPAAIHAAESEFLGMVVPVLEARSTDGAVKAVRNFGDAMRLVEFSQGLNIQLWGSARLSLYRRKDEPEAIHVAAVCNFDCCFFPGWNFYALGSEEFVPFKTKTPHSSVEYQYRLLPNQANTPYNNRAGWGGRWQTFSFRIGCSDDFQVYFISPDLWCPMHYCTTKSCRDFNEDFDARLKEEEEEEEEKKKKGSELIDESSVPPTDHGQ